MASPIPQWRGSSRLESIAAVVDPQLVADRKGPQVVRIVIVGVPLSFPAQRQDFLAAADPSPMAPVRGWRSAQWSSACNPGVRSVCIIRISPSHMLS